MNPSLSVADPPSDKAKRDTSPIASPPPRTRPCQSCYEIKQTCVYLGSPGGRCHQCALSQITCKPLEWIPTTPVTPREQEGETEDKESIPDSLLQPSPVRAPPAPRRSSSGAGRNFSSTSTELTSSHDGREARAPRRASKQAGRRAPLNAGASFSIDAVQLANSTSLVQDDILQPSELVELYHLYMTRWNPCVLVLDPNLHTLQHLTKTRLLLTVVLAVAAQEYPAHPELYGPLMRYSRRIAADELFHQTYDIEQIQAFLLLSMFPDWSLSLDQNRSWLDLGWALELAKRMNIEQQAATYNSANASPSDRNIFRTWMICHNLDIIATIQFDKPSVVSGSVSPRQRVWPVNPGDGSLESVVGALTVPLEHIGYHLRRQSYQKLTHGADFVLGIKSGEHATSSFLFDLSVIETMSSETERAKGSLSTNDNATPLELWIYLADIATKYSRLLLMSRYSSMYKVIRDSDLRSRMLDPAVSILQSYVDMAGKIDGSRYAPGCFFAYGVLAAGVVSKLSGNDDTTRDIASLLDQFLAILQRSPAVAGDRNRLGIFVRLAERFRAGGMSDPGPVGVSMITNGFPAWWKIYL